MREARVRFGFEPILIRVYLPGAESPTTLKVPLSLFPYRELSVDFLKGWDDEEALQRLEDLIRSGELRDELDPLGTKMFLTRFPAKVEKHRA
jgi:hypothetical protein